MTRTLLVASAGGHLDELMIHIDRLGIDRSSTIWVTSPTPQTESLLSGQDVVWVPRVGSGEIAKAALGLPAAMKIHRRIRPDLVVSTGALFSTPHLLAAALAGCETWFIDSATRVAGPSSTGKFVQRFTKAKLYTQSDRWTDQRWTPVPSVFDAFEAYELPIADRPSKLARATVSLGSELWQFPRAIERVERLLPDADVTWQVGVTEYSREGQPLPQWLPANKLRAAIALSDVVVMHAGVGSVLVALDEGKVPVILPRRQHHKEMVDDHQTEIASVLAERGLAISVDPDDLSLDHLVRAASLSARRRANFSRRDTQPTQ
ncbi:hypothetical protein [Micropruina sp.]|uniref:hypothetical protein n=1 Tax=Micropruina sp. TaxID=2737536 RepID=UPI0039E60A53